MSTSEAGNKKLIRRIANALGILDVKQVPSRLETDDIKVVAAIAKLQDPKFVVVTSDYDDSIINLSGLTRKKLLVVDPSVGPNPAAVFPYNQNQETDLRVISVTAELNYTVAGLAAQLNNRPAMRWFLSPVTWDVGNGPPAAWQGLELAIGGVVKNGNAVVAGISKYIMAIPGMSNSDANQVTNWTGIIPRNWKLGLEVINLNNAQTAEVVWGPAVNDCSLRVLAAFMQAEKGFFEDLPR
jgi:hypothetical protein